MFYRGFAEAIKDMNAEQTKEFVTVLCDYALDGKEPECEGLMSAIFKTVKPQIDKNNQKYENGKKGGAPKGNANAKKTTKNNLKQPKTTENNQKQPNVNVNANVNGNVNVNAKSNKAQAHDLFEYLWAIYPNKKGKGQVSDKAKQRLLDIGSEHMERAIERYKGELSKDEWRKPQYGSTFFNSGYVDYLDDNFVPSQRGSPKKSGNPFLDLLTEDSS